MTAHYLTSDFVLKNEVVVHYNLPGSHDGTAWAEQYKVSIIKVIHYFYLIIIRKLMKSLIVLLLVSQ